MALQLAHIKQNELEGFPAAGGVVGARQRDIGFDLGDRDFNRFGQQRNVLVGTFDIVERSLGAMAHLRTSSVWKTHARRLARAMSTNFNILARKPEGGRAIRARGRKFGRVEGACYIENVHKAGT
jgi:hypothetical protein